MGQDASQRKAASGGADIDQQINEEIADQDADIANEEMIEVGVVLRRERGTSRWAPWRWRVSALLPGAGPARGAVLAENAEAGVLELHAATLPLELHRTEVEGYRVSLAMTPPSVFVALRPDGDPRSGEAPEAHLITASAYEAQDYNDGDGEQVEAAPAPPELLNWIGAFVDRHWKDEVFKKRQRDRYAPAAEDGKGDARVRQEADVYRAPGALKPKRLSGAGADKLGAEAPAAETPARETPGGESE